MVTLFLREDRRHIERYRRARGMDEQCGRPLAGVLLDLLDFPVLAAILVADNRSHLPRGPAVVVVDEMNRTQRKGLTRPLKLPRRSIVGAVHDNGAGAADRPDVAPRYRDGMEVDTGEQFGGHPQVSKSPAQSRAIGAE